MGTKKDHRRGQDKDKFERKAHSVKRHEKARLFEKEAQDTMRQFRKNRELVDAY